MRQRFSCLQPVAPNHHEQPPDLGKLGLRDYHHHIQRIIDQKLLSSLSSPSHFHLSEGCVVRSLEEAAHIIQGLVNYNGPTSTNNYLLSNIVDRLRSSLAGKSMPLDNLSGTSSPLLTYYGSCTLKPWGDGYIKMQLGDGVIPHSLSQHLGVPLLLSAERCDFLLNPIPNTDGAKAFSIVAAKDLVQKVLGSYSHCEGYGEEKFLVVCLDDFSVRVSFALQFYNPYAVQDENRFSVYPCQGCQLPQPLQEKLIVTIIPLLPAPNRQLDEVTSYNGKLSQLSCLITDAVTSIFGMKSPQRVKALASGACSP